MREYIFKIYRHPTSIADSSPACTEIHSGRFQATEEDMHALIEFYNSTRVNRASLTMNVYDAPPLTREQGGVIAEELNQPLIVDHVVE